VRRALLPLLGTLLAAPVLGTVAAAPALAHTRLVSSTPASGVPAQAPGEISLDFTDPVQPGLSTVSVTGEDGQQRAAGTPTAGGDDDASVTQALVAPLDPGTYRVAYRVLAADGHPVTGSFEVTVVAAPSPTATPASPAPRAVPTPEASAGPSLRPAAEQRDEDGGLPALPLLVGGLVVAGTAGVLARRLGGDLPRA
jgi:hypothetical protein